MSEVKEQKQKEWWKSKTIWVNIIAIAALIVQSQFGYVLQPEEQIMILTMINIVLRAITNAELEWKIKELN